MQRTRHIRRLLTGAMLVAAPSLTTACGDPLVVLGDAPGYMRVVVGIPDSSGGSVAATATRTRLSEPTAVAFIESSALLHVSDRGATRTSQGITQRVARIMSVTSGGELTLLLDAGGCLTGPCMLEPSQMAVTPEGALVIADAVGNRVFRFEPGTRALSVVAGTGADATAPDGTPAAQAPLSRPAGVAVGDDGVIYIAETGAHRVRRIDAAGALRTVAGTGVGTHSGDAGPAVNATIAMPTGLAFSRGRLFVSESGTHSVRAIELSSGTISTVAGSLAQGFAGDGGPALQARLSNPRALTVSADGNTLFIADRDNHRVRAVNLASGTIRTFSGTGATQFNGSRQPAGDAALRNPGGLWASARGFLFIADTGHQVVWRATLSL